MALVLIDTSALIYRAYFAIPPLLRASDGLQINAVYGVAESIWRLLKKLNRPSHIAAVFDHKSKTFRHNMYPAYKANRPSRPSALTAQMVPLRRAIELFGIPTLDAYGYEADDLIATYAREATRLGMETIILSPDKDLLQLIDNHVSIVDISTLENVDRLSVIELYGVPPENLVDMFALMGDVTDNVPGVSGIGQKKAAKLIQEYGDLENVLKNVNKIRGALGQSLRVGAEDARLSKELVKLADVPLEIPLEWITRREVDYNALIAFLQEYGCFGLAREVAEFSGISVLG